MKRYRICIEDRNYSKWTTYMEYSNESITLSKLNPIESKLFTYDVFTITEDGKTEVVHSTLKNTKNIPGVLILAGKTYGRRGKKLLWKLIPDDKRLPIFLVAKEAEQKMFNKHPVNKYVVFEFKNWDAKHPEATITNTLGSVDKLNNFYEYQLYCKSLHASIQKFTRDTSRALRIKTEDEYIDSIMKTHPEIENRLQEYVISIDPKSSGDFDDAFSIKPCNESEYILSIYISNVSIWMDTLDIWESFSERISTIYLPDRKRPMLPTCLADCLCSLIANSRRFAITCDIYVKNNTIMKVDYKNSLIKVSKNYIYEEQELLKDSKYKYAFSQIYLLSKKYNLISEIHDSHDIIHYLMVLMNSYSAKEMIKYKNGIYRAATINQVPELPTTLSSDFLKFMNMWNSSGGQYVLFSNEISHDILNLDNYIHITSPIRRLPDLLNIIKMQKNLSLLNLSDKAEQFYNNWLSRLDYINITMRAIRKVQVDCNLLNYVYNNTAVMNNIYKGNVFDRIKRNDGLFQYMCYIPALKLVSRLTLRNKLDTYENIKVKLYIFTDEDKIKKNIHLQII